MDACAEGPPQLAQSVALPPRSLLMFRGAAYTDCLHGVREASHFTSCCFCLRECNRAIKAGWAGASSWKVWLHLAHACVQASECRLYSFSVQTVR